MAVKEGTKANKVEVLKSTGGINKLRCQRDQALTVTVPDGKGGVQQQCPVCKSTITSTRLD
jgi:hypothetical protein